MPFPEVPPQHNHRQIAQVIHTVAKDPHMHTSTKSIGHRKMNHASTQALHMVPQSGVWKIVSIDLPHDWDYDKAFDNPLKQATYFETKEYSPPGEKEVKISFGVVADTSETGERSLHNLLTSFGTNSQPRDLTVAEIKSLGDTLYHASDDSIFNLKHISIRRLARVPVLLFEGTYRNSGISTLTVVIDADGKGHPEYLFFQAPEDPHAAHPYSKENLYALYRPLALEAFKTVKFENGYVEKFSDAAQSKPDTELPKN